VIKKAIWIVLYILCCMGVIFFILASIGSYEDHYTDHSGPWYSRESMEPYQYAAYLLTYLVSFPLGTLLSVYDERFLAARWLMVCVPNFIIYFYLAKTTLAVLKKGPGLRP
jgi:hypothetical protein